VVAPVPSGLGLAGLGLAGLGLAGLGLAGLGLAGLGLAGLAVGSGLWLGVIGGGSGAGGTAITGGLAGAPP
jgi:hypothetical protein